MKDEPPSIGNRLRLNLGSGKWNLEGWYNIDAIVSPLAQRQPDLICDLRSIPLPDGCAIEAMAIHVWEHIDRWECDRTIDEWARLLQPGAALILEMPDLDVAATTVRVPVHTGHSVALHSGLRGLDLVARRAAKPPFRETTPAG